MIRMRPTRSVRPVVTLRIFEPAFSVPEYTRKYVSLPTNGSAMILKPSAANGSESSGCRTIGSPRSPPLRILWPSIGLTSSGEGR